MLWCSVFSSLSLCLSSSSCHRHRRRRRLCCIDLYNKSFQWILSSFKWPFMTVSLCVSISTKLYKCLLHRAHSVIFRFELFRIFNELEFMLMLATDSITNPRLQYACLSNGQAYIFIECNKNETNVLASPGLSVIRFLPFLYFTFLFLSCAVCMHLFVLQILRYWNLIS